MKEDYRVLVYEHSGKPVMVGDTVTDFRGEETYIVASIEPPKHSGSTGRVYVRASDGFINTFYPSVIGAHWVDRRTMFKLHKGGRNPGRFHVYSGDIKYVVPSDDLNRAFSAAKTFSVHHGESALYDRNVDRMIAHFVNGILTKEGEQTKASRSVKYKRKGPALSNPRGVLIYAQVNRIIATKKQKHICDAECKRHGHRYFHDFTSSPKMYGLPNGDLLITTR